jgi:hypothetical protein
MYRDRIERSNGPNILEHAGCIILDSQAQVAIQRSLPMRSREGHPRPGAMLRSTNRTYLPAAWFCQTTDERACGRPQDTKAI